MGLEWDSKEVAGYYNDRVEYMSQKNARHKRICKGLERCHLVYPRTVLDLGCGTGITSIFMARQGCQVTGVDLADKLIEYAKEFNSNKNTTYLVGDATEIDLEKEFDIIVLADCIEHCDPRNLEGLFRNINKHAHGQTLVYVNLPVDLFQEFGQDKFEQQIVDNRIPLGMLLAMFDSAGFIVADMDTVGLGAPLEYYELIFITKAHALAVYAECYQIKPASSDEEVPLDGTLEKENK